MRRSFTTKYVAAALIVLLFGLSCGCAWVGQALDAFTPAETEAPAATKKPETTEVPAASFADNPVFIFFTEFYRAYGKAANGLFDAVIEKGDATVSALYMQAMKDEAFISLVYATVGMLQETDGASAFSGTFTGAYAGAGKLTFTNSFSYVFDSGAEIRGTLKDGALRCEYLDGDELISIMVVRANLAYYAWVMGSEETSALEIKQGSFRYSRFDNVLLADFMETEFPTAAGVPVLSYIGGSLWISE